MITVERATMDDAAAAARILRASIIELCVADHAGDPKRIAEWTANKTPENVAAWIAAPEGVVLLAKRDGAPAGVGATDGGGAVLLNYVAPEHVGHGVGGALLRALEAALAADGAALGRLASTKTAFAFYERHGWRPAAAPRCALGPQIDGLACNQMEKELRAQG